VVDAADPLFAGRLATRVRAIETWLLESQATVDSAIGRVAKRFALLYTALELAHHYELLPFDTAQIPWAVSTVFRDWFGARGGAGSIEVKQAVERFEQVLLANEYGDRLYTLPNNEGRQVRNLLGYRLIDSNKHSKTFGQTEEFWIPSIIFEKELAVNVNKGEFITELQQRNLLTKPRADGQPKAQRRVNGRREYFYVIPWKVFCSESAEFLSQQE
jgi:putative DNA primase/helicase